MSKESVVFALAGAFFGLIVGWIIGSQNAAGRQPAPVASVQPPAPQAGASAEKPPPPFDEERARALELQAQRSPSDPAVRAELGNLFFDGERYDQAIRWYEESLRLNPRNVNVSTDLGVCYYYTNQPDRALAQFDRSLAIDPKHTKTILNVGIVRAWGKQDLTGAADAWQKVISLAPESPEARAARQALESMKAAHPGVS
jgi:tetratricopeptide (TPR) repeat protein